LRLKLRKLDLKGEDDASEKVTGRWVLSRYLKWYRWMENSGYRLFCLLDILCTGIGRWPSSGICFVKCKRGD
jgi:hypothetical protein